MQIPLRTLSSAEAYVSNQEWRDARLSNCPSHPLGGGSFARHGSYTRVTPQGLRIARWYCPEGRQTFSLLPDFVAARLPGLLASIDDSITVASSAKSMEVAASFERRAPGRSGDTPRCSPTCSGIVIRNSISAYVRIATETLRDVSLPVPT